MNQTDLKAGLKKLDKTFPVTASDVKELLRDLYVMLIETPKPCDVREYVEVCLTSEQVAIMHERFPGFRMVGQMLDGTPLFMHDGFIYAVISDGIVKCSGWDFVE